MGAADMVNILLHGACGRMGHVIAELAGSDPDVTIIAGVDAFGEAYSTFPVYRSLGEVKESADVIVDFSNAKAADGLLAYAEEKKIPLVLCTTGLSEEQIRKVKETSEKGCRSPLREYVARRKRAFQGPCRSGAHAGEGGI